MKIAFGNLSMAALLLAAACGGKGENAALGKSFDYGAPQAPSSSEQAAATSAQSSLTQAAKFNGSPDAAKASAVVAFADVLAGAALAGGFSVRDRHDIHALVRSAATMDACVTVAGQTVTFTNCQQSFSGFTVTLNGSISGTASSVTWNLSGGFSGSNDGVSADISMHQSGDLSVAATTIKGKALSDFGGSMSAQGRNMSFGMATAVLVDLTYQAEPACVTAGTVEVKRVWTERPSGANASQLPDGGVKISWTGCNALQVARSK